MVIKLKINKNNLTLGILALYGIIMGSEVSSMSIFLTSESFRNYFGVIVERDQALIASSNAIGAIIGCVIFGETCDNFGFVLSFQLSNLSWIIGSVIVITLEYLYILILGRFFKGISLGLISCLVPVYISELFPPNEKGSAISVFHLFAASSTIVVYFLGFILESHIQGHYSFKIAWCVETIPSILLIVLTLVLPESPKRLAWKAKSVAAVKSLDKLRMTQQKITEAKESNCVAMDYTTNRNINFCIYRDLLTRSHWKSIFSGIILHIFIQLTCISTLMYFINHIWEMCGLVDDLLIKFTTGQYIILAFSTIIPVVLSDEVRRIDFLSYGIFVIGLIFMGIFTVFHLSSISISNSNTFERDSPFDLAIEVEHVPVILALFFLLVSVYSSSIISISWLYSGELFPHEIRTKGIGICMGVSWIVNALTTLILPFIFQIARHYSFLILGIVSMIGTIFLLLLPETKTYGINEVITLSRYKIPTDKNQQHFKYQQ